MDNSVWIVCGECGASVRPCMYLNTSAKIVCWYQCMDSVWRVQCIGVSVYVSGYQCMASVWISECDTHFVS